MMTPAPSPNALVEAALGLALEAHAGQVRKDGRTPYVVHPVAVMRRLSSDLGVTDPHLLAAAVLHDVLEDSPTPRSLLAERFGEAVARLVEELTLPPGFHGPDVADEVKTDRLVEDVRGMSHPALVLKLCDRWDNLADAANSAWDEGKRSRFREQTRRLLEEVDRRLANEPFGAVDRGRVERAAGAIRELLAQRHERPTSAGAVRGSGAPDGTV